jgi:hypothetical protein
MAIVSNKMGEQPRPERKHMSLNVSDDLLATAERGEVTDAEFVSCVRESLPYAWEIVSRVMTDLRAEGGDFADHEVPPPSCCAPLPATRSAAAWNGTSARSSPSRTATGWPPSTSPQSVASATSVSSHPAASC